MAGVRRVEDRVRQAATAADDRTRMLQSKVEELEAANLARLLEVRQLEMEKAELQREVQAKRPDLAAAISARDDALKKLEHARKVIEDLVRDHEVRALQRLWLDCQQTPILVSAPESDRRKYFQTGTPRRP